MRRKSLALFSIMGIILFSSCLFFVYNQQSEIFLTDLKPPKGIIVISLDTLRADHLGTYGYHRNTSPHIDAFANESVVFDKAVVQAPLTLPSHMSIMTSLYPSSHGVLKKNNRLADEHVTLAELLREGGYKTAAFADGAFMKGSYGFKQGFDLYDGDEWIGIARILPKAKKWLEENKANPFFLFIHCYDVHDPYDPPPPYDTIFHDFTYTGTFVPTTKNMQAAAWRRLKVNDEDLRHIKALYDGGIRYTDEKIGGFLSYLEETGLLENSLVIITSDHGEEFKEHGSFLHWKLYFRPNLHVPLVMHIPNYPKKGIRVRELVQSIDILPTILEIAQLPPHPEAQGRSLLPSIKEHSTYLGRFWCQISHLFTKDENTSIAEHFEPLVEMSHNISMIIDRYQVIYKVKSESLELFDLKYDPLTQEDIASEKGTVVQRLLSKLKALYAVLPKYKAATFTLDKKTRGQLAALGYINDTEYGGETSQFSRGENHWLEAEDADTIVAPLVVADDEKASGKRFIEAPNGAGNAYNPENTVMATYTVTITRAGAYVLWGRVQARDRRDNSFFVQTDESQDNMWEVEPGVTWHWDQVNDRFGPDPVMFTLAPGVHTIRIKLREDGTKLDKILLTNDTHSVPRGEGALVGK